MPAWSSSPISPVLARLVGVADTDTLGGASVLAALSQVPDPRARRGVRHQIASVLALAACAVLAGCRSFTAIGEWAAGASDQVLAALAHSWLDAGRASRRFDAFCSAWTVTR